MKRILLTIICSLAFFALQAQDTPRVIQINPGQSIDTTINADTIYLKGNVTINKDPRLDMLEQRIAAYAGSALAGKKISRTGFVKTNGYRLMVLNTSDRNQLMDVRTRLLQAFPDQQPYVIFQAPFTKLKFGDFISRPEAERYRKQIMSMKIVTNNIYIVSEQVIVKADKLAPAEPKK